MATTIDNFKLVPLPKNTVAVIRADGRIYIADFTEFPQLDDPSQVDWNLSVSKLYLAKIKSNRTRFVTMEEIEIENIVHTEQPPSDIVGDLGLTVHGSLDGKSVDSLVEVTPTTSIDANGFIQAKCRVTANNFGIMLRGTYNVNTISVTLHNSGRR